MEIALIWIKHGPRVARVRMGGFIQCDISTGSVIDASTVRVAPPIRGSAGIHEIFAKITLSK
ncbi:hypothetical protein LFL97_10360 [Burkholderia sp. JSH-S8]|nr:hypothetical protein LFL97_10360 [Burkholderia sp. JSH-S8]